MKIAYSVTTLVRVPIVNNISLPSPTRNKPKMIVKAE